MGNMSEEELEKARDAEAERAAERAGKLDASIQFAIVTVMGNFSNGASWGFCKKDDILPYMPSLKKNNNIIARKLKGDGCMVELPNDQYFIDTLLLIDPCILMSTEEREQYSKCDAEKKRAMFQYVRATQLKEMAENRKQACEDLEKFLERKAKEGRYKGTIGIYCLNDTATMTKDGVSYPAFKITAKTLVQALSKHGYMIMIEGKPVNPQQISTPEMSSRFWNSLVLNETARGIRGVFVNIVKM